MIRAIRRFSNTLSARGWAGLFLLASAPFALFAAAERALTGRPLVALADLCLAIGDVVLALFIAKPRT